MNPKYPVYIISKGRYGNPTTARKLDKIGVPYHIVVEPQEAENYASVPFIGSKKVLELPFSNLGQGSIPARNWVWEHATKTGAKRHWIMDDNITNFVRFHKNTQYTVGDGAIFKIMEDFVDRYTNVHMAGPQYHTFANRRYPHKHPVRFNVRIYSCILLSNEIDYQWRGRYNEDTDLSLRILKDGHCTAIFYAFLADKTATMRMKGGNTDELYKQNEVFDGRYEMARQLQEQHPDVTKIDRKWGRWQHVVNYKPFRGNEPKFIKGFKLPKEPNNYGMELKDNAN